MNKRVITALLVFCILLSLLPETVFAAPEESTAIEINDLEGIHFTYDFLSASPSEEAELDEYQRDGYTLNEIREMLQQGDAVGQKRVYRPNVGPSTYEVSTEEILEVFGEPEGTDGIQALHNFTYAVRPIIGEGRPCSESIVIVLLGDGFTAGHGPGQVGNYQNPLPGTFLHSAHQFADTLINMYPFSLFSDIFKVYAVETPSTQGIRVGTSQSPANAAYPGTYLGTFLSQPWNIGFPRLSHALNISNWVSPNTIMTQIIANTTVGGGVAWGAGSGYNNMNTVGISTRFTGAFIPGWSSPAYHSIVIHEIGHNFGRLMDEHSQVTAQLGRANIASASDTDAQLKWGHLLGHGGVVRRAQNAPSGFIFPSQNSRCKMEGWVAAFCTVCNAELTRRMAMISGETFEVGRRPDGSMRNPTPNVTVTSHNRILPYAFHGNTSLETLTIPASVSNIGNFAFVGATGLTTIFNNNVTTPQQINDTTFAGLDRSTIDVHILPGMAPDFIAAGWTGFTFVEVQPGHGITVNTQGNGTAVASEASASQGTTVTLTATPDTGYRFVEWQVVSGGVTLSATTANPATFSMLSSEVVILAVFEEIPPTNHNITVNTQGNGTAGASVASASQGTEITLTADPGIGYDFAGWQVESGGVSLSSMTSSPATFTMPNNDVTILAIFEEIPPTNHSITVNTQGNGTAGANMATASQGATITLTAAPGNGYDFVEWQVVSGGVSLSSTTSNPATFTMPNNEVTVLAIFEEILQTNHSITVNTQGNGTAVTSEASASQGTTITLTATPDYGYKFVEWQVVSGGVTFTTTTTNTVTFTMPDNDVTILAIFEEIPPTNHSITVNAQGNGTAVASEVSASLGIAITLTATPDSGYDFAEWQVVSGGVILSSTTSSPVTFTMPDNEVTILAVFEEIPPINHNIMVNTQGSGTAVASEASASQGTAITLTATPGSGYNFAEWQVVSGGVILSTMTSSPATFSMPDNEVTILAIFEEVPTPTPTPELPTPTPELPTPTPESPTPTPESPTPTPEPPTPTPESPTPTPEPPTPTPESPTPTPESPTPTPEPPTPESPTPTLEPPTPTPEPPRLDLAKSEPTPDQPEMPGQWDPSVRSRARAAQTQMSTNVTPTPLPEPPPTHVSDAELRRGADTEPRRLPDTRRRPDTGFTSGIVVPELIQARSFTTVNEHRQIAPSLADALFELSLFVGTGVDEVGVPTFELDRSLTRMEALTLVVRLMGLEDRALEYTGSNPFDDTPDWGSRIVAFAFNEGITAGTGNGLFAPDRCVTYQEFTAFLLRALGYFEMNGDFSFCQALEKAVEVGLFCESQRNIQEGAEQYLRADTVLNMVNALLTNTNGTNTSILDTLVANDVVCRLVADQFVAQIGDLMQF